MAERTKTTWTCDRCGAEEVVDQGTQPAFWVRVTKAQPPRHADPKRLGDLCMGCRAALDEWWRAGEEGRTQR